MKHKEKSASCFEFACPHLSDHRTQKAKPNNRTRTDELCTFSSVGADVRRLASFSSPGGEDTDEGVPPCATTIREVNVSCWAPESWRAGAANLAYFAVSK